MISIDTTITPPPSDATCLVDLQKSFDVTDLGNGDPIVGFNILATMACTLADIAPDDGNVIHPDGSPARLGTSLLLMGSASTGRVVDEVICEVVRRQNNLISHLNEYSGWLKKIASQPDLCISHPKSEPGTSFGLIEETQSQFGDIVRGHAGSWRKVLERTPQQSIQQIEKHPRFLVSVSGRKDIEAQLTRLRPGCALVHMGLSHPNDLAYFSEVGSALLEGRYALDDNTGTIKGNLLITDPMHVLMAAAQNPDERTSWLGQLLWLTDADSGPDAPLAKHTNYKKSNIRIEERFRHALSRVMTHRFNPPNRKPIVLFCDIREASIRWTLFLKEMEPRLPGISGAARNFLTSLVFGMGLMMTKLSKTSVSEVEALARFLIRRMANARIAILHSGEIARRRGQITRIFHKLSSSPSDKRKICQDLKISAADRDEALRWLLAANLISNQRNEWERREGAQLNFTDCTVPILEV